MTTQPGRHTIEISDKAYEVLAATAKARGTDLSGAVDYLMQVPQAPTATRSEDDDEE